MDTSLMNALPLDSLSIHPEATAHGDTEIFVPKGVCAKQIRFVIEGDTLAHVEFTGGCEGNLKAVSQLLEGMPVQDVIKKMGGITCGNKPTSCVDQLSQALAAKE